VFVTERQDGGGGETSGVQLAAAGTRSARRTGSTGRARPARLEESVIEVEEAAARRKPGKRRRRQKPKKVEKKKKGKVVSSSDSEAPDGKRAKKGRPRRRSPSSSTSEGSSGSSSGSESASSASPTKASRGSSKTEEATWTLLNDIWPLEERPRKLQDKRYVSKLSWQTLMGLQDRYEKEMEKKGVGAAIFGKDRKLSKVQFEKKSDDCCGKLHPARWLRLPMVAPEKYWEKVPRAHEQRFRHLQLGHYGAESQINEKVILSLHDRQVRNGQRRCGTRYDGGTVEA